MSPDEIYRMIAACGIDTYQYRKKKETTLPVAVLTVDGETVRGSDCRNFIKRTEYTLELYTKMRDEVLMARIGQELNTRGIEYGTAESYLDSESMYMVAFSFDTTRKV